MQVEIYLVKDVKGLGKQGTIVKVKRGYAVNYLIPKGFARIATEEDKQNYKKQLKQKEEEERLKLEMLENVKKFVQKRLVKNPVRIEVQTSAGGKVYKSIKPEEVRQALLDRIPQLKMFSAKELKIDMPAKIEYIGKYAFDVIIDANIGGRKIQETIPIFVDVVSISKAHLKTEQE